MPQSQNTVPEIPAYKKALNDALKSRLGRYVNSEVAHRCGYSREYVRSWFLSENFNRQIMNAAQELLQELREEEDQILKSTRNEH